VRCAPAFPSITLPTLPSPSLHTWLTTLLPHLQALPPTTSPFGTLEIHEPAPGTFAIPPCDFTPQATRPSLIPDPQSPPISPPQSQTPLPARKPEVT